MSINSQHTLVSIAAFILAIGSGSVHPGQALKDLGASISVLDAEDLERTGVTSASDLLKKRSGRLVLVNGNRSSVEALTRIPGNAIESVEVLRDGASAVYGSDAIGGVVNVITRDDSRAPTLSDALSGYSGLTLAYDSPKWCNHWGGRALLPFGSYPALPIADNPSGNAPRSIQPSSGADPFSGRRQPTPNAYDVQLQQLAQNYIVNIEGKNAAGGFDNPTDWFDGNPLSPTFVMGLVLIKDMYWRQLTEMRNQLQQLQNMSEEGRLALYGQLRTDAGTLDDAFRSMNIAEIDANRPRPNSHYSWKDMHDALLSQAADAERLGDTTEAAELRDRANRTIWAVYQRSRREFASLLDENPLLAFKVGGDFLFERIIALENDIAVPGLLEAITEPTRADYDKTRLALLQEHFGSVIKDMDETRGEVSNERHIDDLVKYAGPQFLRQQQAVSLMGVQQGGAFAGELMSEVQYVHQALEADDIFWNGVIDGSLSALAVGSVLIPVVGPFLSGGFALIEVGRDGTEMVIKYHELGAAEGSAAFTGHVYVIRAQDAASAAADQFVFTTLTSVLDVAALTNIKVLRRGKVSAGDAAGSGARTAAGSGDNATAAIARAQDVLPAGARPHVAGVSDADGVLNRIDGDALDARFLKDDIGADDLADFLKKNDLEPRETIVSGGQTYHVSRPFKGPGDRTAVVVLQETGDGKVVPRTFYLSGEHGVWRNLPAVNLTPKGPVWSKGPSTVSGSRATSLNEGVVDIGAEMQGPLDGLVNRYGVRELDSADDATRAATGHIELTTPDKGPKEFGATVKADDAANRLVRHGNGNLPDGMRPDWQAGPRTTSVIENHPLYGRLERFTYLSEDGSTLWVINRGGNGDVWIGSVQDAQAGLTGFGTRWEAFDAGDITTMPYTKGESGYVPNPDWQNPFNNYMKGRLPTSRVASQAPAAGSAAGSAAAHAGAAAGDPLQAVGGTGRGTAVSVVGSTAAARALMRLEGPEPPLPLDGVVYSDAGFDEFPVGVGGFGSAFNIDLPLLASIQYADGDGGLEVPIDTVPHSSAVLHADADAAANPFSLMPGTLWPYYRRSFSGNPKMIVLRYPQTLSSKIQSEVAKSRRLVFDPNTCRTKLEAPHDPYTRSGDLFGNGLPDQWALDRIGLGNDATSLWEVAGNGEPVTVAVIDTGLDWFHKDIDRDNVWFNADETPGNGRDDDGNGYVDDIIGWDFMENDNKPWDRDGHGTFVSGLIAAAHNDIGIAGINPRARIMVLKALNSFGNTRASFLAEAIFYAVDNGARIINLSVGGREVTGTERVAIEYALDHDVLVVTASGNEGIDVAKYGIASFADVLTVGASDPDDRVPGFSNRGNIDVVAPGVDILSLRGRRTDLTLGAVSSDYLVGDNAVGDDKRYIHATGTSFAAPLATGVASILLSRDPELSAETVARIIVHSAVDIGAPGVDLDSGFGRLDARAALLADSGFYVEARIEGVSAVSIGGNTLVRVTGTVDADRFKSARVELGAGENPDRFVRVGKKIRRTVEGAALVDIPVSSLAGSNVWIIRVVTEHRSGRRREHRFRLQLG